MAPRLARRAPSRTATPRAPSLQIEIESTKIRDNVDQGNTHTNASSESSVARGGSLLEKMKNRRRIFLKAEKYKQVNKKKKS